MIDICTELHQNFLDFAYEANSERAFPSAVDGLKPGQRAALWTMYSKGFLHKKPHVKSAKIAGTIVAEYWPHGDVAVYETFARMSQPWINNLPEVEWHGANGNQIVPNGVAASRYTEARLSKMAEDGMFQGIKKHNVPMILNFSEDAEWPETLPCVFPRLYINGSQGIGVALSQQWLPHNLQEIGDIILNYLKTNTLDYSSLVPDFPTGGIIINKNDVHKIYDKGVGKVILRGKATIEDNHILITELPYQIYVEPFIEEIKSCITKDKITLIKNIYNKSDKKQLLIDIEVTDNPSTVLNQLYKETSLQKNFTAHQYALVGKTPVLLTLKDYIDLYIQHNLTCIQKEYTYDKEQAQNRLEIVEGLLKALEDIDNVITLIKESQNAAAARANLREKYDLTEKQSAAIVNMKLGSLAKLEGIDLQNEKSELDDKIHKYAAIIENKNEQIVIFEERLQHFLLKYGKPRKTSYTQIVESTTTKKENIPAEDVVITLTNKNSITRTSLTEFKTQKRKTKGNRNKEQVIATCHTNTRENLLLFTQTGIMYKVLVNKISPDSPMYLEDLIKIDSDTYITAMAATHEDMKKYICFVTQRGYIKKIVYKDLTTTKRNTSSKVIKLADEDDYIVNAFFCDDGDEVIIASSEGKCIRFSVDEFNATGKTSRGCKCIKFKDPESGYITGATIVNSKYITVVYKDGKGVKVLADDFSSQKRYGVGVNIGKNAPVAALISTTEDANLLIIGKYNTICIAQDELTIGNKENGGLILIKDNEVQRVEVC